MHRAFFNWMNVECSYEAMEVAAGGLKSFLQDARGFDGFSVTMPLKEEAYLVSSHSDSWSGQLRAANTLLRSDDGWSALNTDVLGIGDLLRGLAPSPGFDITIVGAGATARAVLLAAQELAAEVTVMSRSHHRQEQLRTISPHCKVIDWDVDSSALDATVVVSTTPAGATDGFRGGAGVLVDVTYEPWPSQLALSWSGPVFSGLELLARQGAHQAAAFWPELEFDLQACYRVMLEAASAI
jgi:shikimate dehydrogenase